jgi:hypothetical protein
MGPAPMAIDSFRFKGSSARTGNKSMGRHIQMTTEMIMHHRGTPVRGCLEHFFME